MLYGYIDHIPSQVYIDFWRWGDRYVCIYVQRHVLTERIWRDLETKYSITQIYKHPRWYPETYISPKTSSVIPCLSIAPFSSLYITMYIIDTIYMHVPNAISLPSWNEKNEMKKKKKRMKERRKAKHTPRSVPSGSTSEKRERKRKLWAVWPDNLLAWPYVWLSSMFRLIIARRRHRKETPRGKKRKKKRSADKGMIKHYSIHNI